MPVGHCTCSKCVNPAVLEFSIQTCNCVACLLTAAHNENRPSCHVFLLFSALIENLVGQYTRGKSIKAYIRHWRIQYNS